MNLKITKNKILLGLWLCPLSTNRMNMERHDTLDAHLRDNGKNHFLFTNMDIRLIILHHSGISSSGLSDLIRICIYFMMQFGNQKFI